MDNYITIEDLEFTTEDHKKVVSFLKRRLNESEDTSEKQVISNILEKYSKNV